MTSHLFGIITVTIMSSYMDKQQHEATGPDEPQQAFQTILGAGRVYISWDVKSSNHIDHFNSLRTQLLNNSVFHFLCGALRCIS